MRDLGLVDREPLGGRLLGEALAPDQAGKLTGQCGLGEPLFWLGELQIRKDVAATSGHLDPGHALLLLRLVPGVVDSTGFSAGMSQYAYFGIFGQAGARLGGRTGRSARGAMTRMGLGQRPVDEQIGLHVGVVDLQEDSAPQFDAPVPRPYSTLFPMPKCRTLTSRAVGDG